MMNSSSLRLLAALALACCGLASCVTDSGHVDVVNPTANQLDEMDVRWGLPKRTSRGTPKRLYNDNSAAAAPAAGVGAVAPAPAPAGNAPVPAPAAPSTVSPEVQSKLR